VPQPGQVGGDLELRDLSRRFGAVRALVDFSLLVPGGQLFGFVGPNGAGKTTAMRIILGVLAPDAGEVLMRGRPLDRAARRRIGYMPEERGLYPKMRVAEQLIYFARLHGLDPAAAAAAARRWIDRLEIAEHAEKPVERLSLGNQQRVQLAVALVHDPDLLVLDEPFSGIDPVGVDVLSAVLREQADRGVGVLFSSHQLELVERLCERVAIIRDGRLVASGEVAALRAGHAERRWRLELDGADAQAAATGLDGVGLAGRDARGATFTLAPDADEQALLAAGLRLGRVRRFEPVEPSLAEIFHEAMVA
jgi:ABC-2 type transport system ATP-binding protein